MESTAEAQATTSQGAAYPIDLCVLAQAAGEASRAFRAAYRAQLNTNADAPIQDRVTIDLAVVTTEAVMLDANRVYLDALKAFSARTVRA